MLRLLHTNDFHGTLDEPRMERLEGLRQEADLYFDCGDCVKAGNLAIPLRADPVWPRLAALKCSASVLGNRESHPREGPFRAKLSGLSHPVVCANLRLRGPGERPFPSSLFFQAAGIRIGVLGVMVPIVTERMATRVASQFLWEEPLAAASRVAAKLRPEVDCLIALTHIGLRRDRELARKAPEIDLILGGHSHDVLAEPERIGRVAICQAGSHGRFAGIYEWQLGPGLVSCRLAALR